MTTEPRLKKAKKCAGCWAYNEQGGAPYGAYCVLGFAVTQLPEGGGGPIVAEWEQKCIGRFIVDLRSHAISH